MREGGLAISLATAASMVRAVLSERCPKLLVENGGPFKVSMSWVSNWLYLRLKWVCRASTTAAQKVPENAAQPVKDMCRRISILAFLYQVPSSLLYAMDETFFFFVPMGGARTYDKQNSKAIAVTATSVAAPSPLRARPTARWYRSTPSTGA